MKICGVKRVKELGVYVNVCVCVYVCVCWAGGYLNTLINYSMGEHTEWSSDSLLL